MTPLAQRLYDAVAWLAQPLVRRKLRRRGQAEPGYLLDVPERFGAYRAPRPQPEGGAPLIWLHAVSLGETRAAAILLPALRARWPGMRLLLTHGTATGRAEGAALLRPGDLQVWQPWDTPAAVRALVQRYRPDLGLLIETEVWPNLVRQSAAAGVPLALVNARLSDPSWRGAQRAGVLMRPVYGALAAVWAQSQADAERLRALGAPVEGVFGNLKFDATPNPALLARGRRWRAQAGRPVVLLASSREGEEAELIRHWRAHAADLPGAGLVRWLIVPRHPQRFDAVAALLQQAGCSVSRRSAWPQDGPPPAGDVLLLGDSLGEMAAYYALADVALLGGSFAPLGGQNLIEAAACGCPLLMGPHTFNFAEAAAQAEAAGAAQRVPDLAQGVRAALALLPDAATRQRMGAAGQAFAAAHRGATARTVQACAELLARTRG